MGFVRANVSPDGKLVQPLRAGDGFIANPIVYQHAADAALTLTAAIISGGMVSATTTLTADRALTIDTGANLAAEFSEMDVGDAFTFVVSSAQVGAFDLIITAAAGVTLKGAGNVSPQCSRTFVLVKTGAATFNLY